MEIIANNVESKYGIKKKNKMFLSPRWSDMQ